MNRFIFSAAALATAAIMTACGGGGGDSAPPVAGPGTPSPTPTASTPTASTSTIVVNVPAPSYAAGSEELAAYNYLNAERSRCGFGKLAEEPTLNISAKNHADWLLINNYYGHYEDPAVPTGYTGITPVDRARFAGYAGSGASETITGTTGNKSIIGYGVDSAKTLNAAPYHLFGMMSPYVDLGISVRSVNNVTSTLANGLSRAAVYNFGIKAETYQSPAKNSVLSYPCDGTTNVNYEVRNEFPNPVPGRNLLTNPIGHAILVMLARSETLSITGSTMVKLSDGSSVPMRAGITAANDPNNLFESYGSYMGYVVPDVALLPATTYKVTVNGTSTGLVENCATGAKPGCVVNLTGQFTIVNTFSTRS